MDSSDILIIGAGAAGAVLAARLSENPSLRVTLIEAGKDTPPGAVPCDIADPFPSSTANVDYFWPDLQATILSKAGPRPYSQARIMGGGSSVMGMWALRGLAADYDGWASSGAVGWSWTDVLPYFKKLERDVDFPNDNHGTDGPVTIARVAQGDWPEIIRTIANAATKKQLPILPDPNTSEGDGIFTIPHSIRQETRVSSAAAYLTDDVRRRENLQILDKTEVRTLAFEDKKVIGAYLRGPDGVVSLFRVSEIVVAAGAIHSPALLQRSGVGNGHDISACGVDVIADIPNVGKNLQNHFYVHFGTIVRPNARQDPAIRRYGTVGMRLSSRIGDAPPSDLLLALIGRTGRLKTGNRVAMIAACLYAPFSRGSVTPNTADPNGPPQVNFNAMSDPRDVDRFLYAARMARDLLQDDATRAVTHESFVLPQNLPIRLLNRSGVTSTIFSGAAAAVFGMNAATRRAALRMLIGPGRFLSDIKNEDEFAQILMSSVLPMFHVSGTCAIGSVVDSRAKVIGVEGLRVVDASIMPTLPRANTNIPTVMIAEKCAAHIAEDLRDK